MVNAASGFFWQKLKKLISIKLFTYEMISVRQSYLSELNLKKNNILLGIYMYYLFLWNSHKIHCVQKF